MAALSDYAESGILNLLLRGNTNTFAAPSNVSIALCSGVPIDSNTGVINLFKLDSPTQPQIVRRNVGTIDYIKGEIVLHPINIVSTSIDKGTPLIEIEAVPYSNDVIGLQDLYLQLDTNKVVIHMWTDEISSGAQVSGTDHQVSSSYSNGVFVR